MDHHRRLHRRTAVVTAAAPHQHQENKETEDEKLSVDPLLALSKPAGFLVQLAATPLEVIINSFLSLLSESEAVPSRVAHGSGALLRRLFLGFIGAVHAIAILVAALAVAVVIGIGLVRLWVEEPVVFRQPLHFDYTNAEPTAVVLLGRAGAKGRTIPPSHTARVTLELLMPESDYNRHIGVFQVRSLLGSVRCPGLISSGVFCRIQFL